LQCGGWGFDIIAQPEAKPGHWHRSCCESSNFNLEITMGQEDTAAGKAKQIKGKLNDIAGAVKGDTGQQIKGKVQKGVGKVQEKIGKKSSS
jgi:uncharacterized protein YjbJ (UPF0337 family)